MAQTFSKILVHVIFSTKDRRPLIRPELRARLSAYMAKVIGEEFGYVVKINGTEDHVHMLIDMKTVTAPATMLRVVKSNSSKWVHETFAQFQEFAWQGGYGIFSVSESNRQAVLAYIEGQEEHHRRRSFQQEFLRFLRKYKVEYDERYIWD